MAPSDASPQRSTRMEPLTLSAKVRPAPPPWPRDAAQCDAQPRVIDYDRPHLVDVATRFKAEVAAEKHTENLKTYADTFYGAHSHTPRRAKSAHRRRCC